jgi:hypothetical protein
MFAITTPTADFIDAAVAAEKLGIPVETILKLRRALDPDLSFEEHREIFPLDLGAVWDLAALSATKTYEDSRAVMRNPADWDAAILEWQAIRHQFAETFRYALGARVRFHGQSDDFMFQQCFVDAGTAQRGTHVHADASLGEQPLVFKESWKAPGRIILIARDEEPNTAYFKMPDHVPDDLIYAGSHKLQYRNADFMEWMKEQNRVICLPAKRIVASTDRTVHAGQVSKEAGVKTFAWARTAIIPHAPTL